MINVIPNEYGHGAKVTATFTVTPVIIISDQEKLQYGVAWLVYILQICMENFFGLEIIGSIDVF